MPTVSIYDAATQVTAGSADADGRVVLATPTGGPDETIAPDELWQLMNVTIPSQTGWVNAKDYGAVNDGTACNAAAGEAAQAAANAAAINVSNIFTAGWQPNPVSGSSIIRKYTPPVVWPPGIYRLDRPWDFTAMDGASIHWICPGAVFVRGGTEVTGNSGTWAGDAAMLIGRNISPTTVAFFIYMDQATFVNFPMSIRAGIAPNNVPQAQYYFNRCQFIGDVDGRSIGVRIFNRSANCHFHDCNFNTCRLWLDIQSCDKTVVTVGRFKVEKRQTSTWDETLADRGSRRTYTAFTRLNYGQLFVRDSIFIPHGANIPNNSGTQPLAWFMQQDVQPWEPGIDWIVGDVCIYDGVHYSCHTANSDAAFNASKWQAWAFPKWVSGQYYDAGDYVNYQDVERQCIVANNDAVFDAAKWTTFWANARSVWGTLDLQGNHFGGEGGGIPAVINDKAPDDKTPAHLPTRINVAHNELAAYSATPHGVSGHMPAVLLRQIPNRVQVTDNCYSQANQVAVDYHAGTTAPTPWTPNSGKTLALKVEGNQGGSGDPNFVPANLEPYLL